MKKITLFLALAISALVSAQTSVTLSKINGLSLADFFASSTPANTFPINTEVTLTVDYEGVPAQGADTSTGRIRIRTFFAGNANVNSVFFDVPVGNGQAELKWTPTTAVTDYRLDTILPDIAEWWVPANGAAFYYDNINVGTATLSSSEFSKSALQGAYYDGADSIVVAEAIEYSIYNLAGVAVAEGTAAGSINVAGLASGVYILSTEAGILKFVK